MTEQDHKQFLTACHLSHEPFEFFGRKVTAEGMRTTYAHYVTTQFFLSCGSTIVFTEELSK